MSSENQTGYSHYDVIALHNIDDEPFEFEYDKSAGNYPYSIPAGEIRRFPRFLASHALKHLIDKILTKKRLSTNDVLAREGLASQIVVEEELYQNKPAVSKAEENKKLVEELNKPSDLENVLGKHKRADEVAGEIVKETPGSKPTQDPDDDFEGKPDIDTTEDTPLPPKVIAMPTRPEIYDYAKNVLKMQWDEKTQKSYDKMKVADLITEIGDPRESLV